MEDARFIQKAKMSNLEFEALAKAIHTNL